MHVGLRVDIGFRLEPRDNRKYRFDGIVKYVVRQALSVPKTGNMYYLVILNISTIKIAVCTLIRKNTAYV
jgi:hypothetical protein